MTPPARQVATPLRVAVLSACPAEAMALAHDLAGICPWPIDGAMAAGTEARADRAAMAAWSVDGQPTLLAACRQPEPPLGHAASSPIDEAAGAHAQSYQLTLLCGLEDVPAAPGGTGNAAAGPGQQASMEALQARLRQALSEAGIAYQVLYGDPQARRLQALAAMQSLCGTGPQHAGQALPPSPPAGPGSAAGAQARERRARMRAYGCEKCSDPECEHQLFQQLLAAR